MENKQLSYAEQIISRRLDQAKMEIINELNGVEQNHESVDTRIRQLAHEKNVSYEDMVDEFVSAFNEKYHTNLRRLVTSYRYKNFIQDDVSVVDYITRVERTEDAIAVLDELEQKNRA